MRALLGSIQYMTDRLLRMASFRRHGKSGSVNLCAVAATMMLTGILLYMSMLSSPALFRGIMHDVVCEQKRLYVDGLSHQLNYLKPQGSQTTAEINSTHVTVAVDRHDHALISIQASQITVGCATTPASASHTSLQKDDHLADLSGIRTAGTSKVFSILIGVFTTARSTERRNLLRLAYGIQSSECAHVTVKFVVGKLKGSEEKLLVGLEILRHNDILILDCDESINGGKTFAFFSTLADSEIKYDYVMKADDDSYLRFDNLGRSLQRLPRTDLYYGYILPCENNDPHAWYMAGMGYLLSWDLVQWIRESLIPRENSVGTEDQLVADWFNEGKKAKNRVNKKPLFYDHPEFGGQCSHELIPETILIHQLKSQERWVNVLSYFEGYRMMSLFPKTQESESPS